MPDSIDNCTEMQEVFLEPRNYGFKASAPASPAEATNAVEIHQPNGRPVKEIADLAAISVAQLVSFAACEEDSA
jgi:hypothetical protein